MPRDINLRYVTITGADDKTEIMDLLDLSARYPFVEWGILFSQSKAGVPRYPSLDWVNELKSLAAAFSAKKTINFSSHLCGKWVSDVLEQGEVTFFKNDETLSQLFGRVQLNCYKEKLKEAVASSNFWKAALRLGKPILLGGNYGKSIELDVRKCAQFGVSALFDASGGHGKTSSSYREPFTFVKADPEKRTHSQNTMFCGYAGGLGPENIEEELEKISQAVGSNQFWIDMESRVRTADKTKDILDLGKVEKVLEIVSKRLSTDG